MVNKTLFCIIFIFCSKASTESEANFNSNRSLTSIIKMAEALNFKEMVYCSNFHDIKMATEFKSLSSKSVKVAMTIIDDDETISPELVTESNFIVLAPRLDEKFCSIKVLSSLLTKARKPFRTFCIGSNLEKFKTKFLQLNENITGFWFLDLSSEKLFRILTFTDQNKMSVNDVGLQNIDGKGVLDDRNHFNLDGAIFR